MIVIFFIPEIIIALMCMTVIVGLLAVNEVMTAICTWGHDNFEIIVLLTLILLIISAIICCKNYGVISALAFMFASSQLLVLFLDTLYQLFTAGLDFIGNGWLTLFIVVPIFIVYTLGDLVCIAAGISNCDETNSSSILWLVGIVGWLLNIFVWS